MNQPVVCLTIALLFTLMNSTIHPRTLRGQQPYRLPPREVVDIIDAAPVPQVRISPDRNWMLLVEREAMPGIADVSRRKLRLAGMRIDPAANGRFMTSYDSGVSLRTRAGGALTDIPLPAGAGGKYQLVASLRPVRHGGGYGLRPATVGGFPG